MSVPENECPHLDTRTIETYGWRTTCCLDCDSQWQTPTTDEAAAGDSRHWSDGTSVDEAELEANSRD